MLKKIYDKISSDTITIAKGFTLLVIFKKQF